MTTKRTLPVLVLGLAIALSGCQTSPAQRGAMGGAALGALGGQLIGGDSEATLIGAGVGALGGAILNDHVDKQKQEAYNQGYNRGAQDATPKPPSYNTAPR